MRECNYSREAQGVDRAIAIVREHTSGCFKEWHKMHFGKTPWSYETDHFELTLTSSMYDAWKAAITTKREISDRTLLEDAQKTLNLVLAIHQAPDYMDLDEEADVMALSERLISDVTGTISKINAALSKIEVKSSQQGLSEDE